MSQTHYAAKSATAGHGGERLIWPLVLISLVALVFVYRVSLANMVGRWAGMEEYSHGYMIPLVAAFLLWRAAPELRRIDWCASWVSPVLMALALFGWALGDLSSIFMISNYSFWLALCVLALATLGWRGMVRIWPALLYLVFTIPLPGFLYARLSEKLQLLSSEMGVAVMRWLDISVYLEGNIIDLGVYKLQVVEACSGLRYLFPLMSFGFLVAVLYKGPRWHKWSIFLATIPITVLMNSARVGLIGITVQYWGIKMAEGILHAFEGWFVFMACLAVLTLFIWFLSFLDNDGRGVLERIDLNYPSPSEVAMVPQGERHTTPTLFVCTLLCILAVPTSLAIANREEIIQERQSLVQFPLLKHGWVGRAVSIDDRVLEVLSASDYFIGDYYNSDKDMPVNFYVAYYDSQSSGSSIHSPRSCLPGGGWKIASTEQLDLSESLGTVGPRVNRVIIEFGDRRELVYYWFEQRGRSITSEYLAKWYLFQDGLLMNRTDGALLRLITPIPRDSDESASDAHLQLFLRDFYSELPRFLPGVEE